MFENVKFAEISNRLSNLYLLFVLNCSIQTNFITVWYYYVLYHLPVVLDLSVEKV